MRLTTKLILSFVLVSLLPIVLLSFFELRETERLSARILDRYRQDLRQASEQGIRQKAADAARQIEVYLRLKPERDPDALHADAYLRSVAVQPVGQTGYTVLYRRDGTVLFHPQQRFEGVDMRAAGKEDARYYAEFYELLQRSLTSEEPVQGYYRWTTGNQVIEKFMGIAPVRGTDLLLAATIPVNEFELPLAHGEQGITSVGAQFGVLLYAVSGLILGLAIAVGALLSLSFTRPIARLQKGLTAFTKGDLLYRIPVRSHDEMGTLSLMFNQMAEELSVKDAQLVRKTKAVEESERSYRRLVENLHDVASVIDAQGRISFVSSSVTEAFGYAPEDLVGTRLLDLVHPDDEPYVEAHIAEAARTRARRIKVEYRLRDKSGAYRTLSVRASMLFSPAGEWLGRVAVSRDVTEERRMEAQVRLLSLAVEQSADGILVSNLEGAVVFANGAWVRLHGFDSAEELIDRHMYRFHPDDEAMRLQDVLQEVLAEGNWSGEVRHLRRDGSTFPSLYMCTLLRDTAGRNIGYVVIATDITERKGVEDRLRRHSDDLELLAQLRTRELQERTRESERAVRHAQEADRMKTEFMAQVSHELRTPLNSIIGFSRLLLRSSDPELPERQRFDVDLIHQNGLYLLELINGILDLSKIEAGAMELSRETFELADVVRETMQTVQPLATLAHLQLVDRVSGQSVPLFADRAKIRQVLFNLLSNAVKFTVSGEVEVSHEQTPTSITIHVRDTGIGLAPAEKDRVFEKFVQVASPHHGRLAGTGIGLTVAKSFIDLHGGKVWVDSEVGRGSTFHVQLPKAQPGDFVTPAPPV